MFNELKDDSSVLISISAGRSSKHLVRLSKPPIFTLQRLIFSLFRVVLKVFNPKRTGLYQFHSYGQPKGKSFTSYLGSWTIVID